jgi:hypothetical protein
MHQLKLAVAFLIKQSSLYKSCQKVLESHGM